ncbi:MAG: hypothetical protein V4713_12440 [Pseudomonadota bacterium]
MQELAPTRSSLLRKIAWLGADRRLVGMSAMLNITLGWTMLRGFGPFYGVSFAVPTVLFFGCLWVARGMYEADPWMVDIVLRQFQYRKYYAPKPDIGMPHPPVKDYY